MELASVGKDLTAIDLHSACGVGIRDALGMMKLDPNYNAGWNLVGIKIQHNVAFQQFYRQKCAEIARNGCGADGLIKVYGIKSPQEMSKFIGPAHKGLHLTAHIDVVLRFHEEILNSRSVNLTIFRYVTGHQLKLPLDFHQWPPEPQPAYHSQTLIAKPQLDLDIIFKLFASQVYVYDWPPSNRLPRQCLPLAVVTFERQQLQDNTPFPSLQPNVLHTLPVGPSLGMNSAWENQQQQQQHQQTWQHQSWQQHWHQPQQPWPQQRQLASHTGSNTTEGWPPVQSLRQAGPSASQGSSGCPQPSQPQQSPPWVSTSPVSAQPGALQALQCFAQDYAQTQHYQQMPSPYSRMVSLQQQLLQQQQLQRQQQLHPQNQQFSQSQLPSQPIQQQQLQLQNQQLSQPQLPRQVLQQQQQQVLQQQVQQQVHQASSQLPQPRPPSPVGRMTGHQNLPNRLSRRKNQGDNLTLLNILQTSQTSQQPENIPSAPSTSQSSDTNVVSQQRVIVIQPQPDMDIDDQNPQCLVYSPSWTHSEHSVTLVQNSGEGTGESQTGGGQTVKVESTGRRKRVKTEYVDLTEDHIDLISDEEETADGDMALPQGLARGVGEHCDNSSHPTLPVLPCFEKQDQIAQRKSQTSDDASHGSLLSIVNISEQPYSVGHASPSEPVGPEVPCTLPPSRMRASLENSDQTMNLQDISNQLTANPTRSTAVSNQQRAESPREVTRSSGDDYPAPCSNKPSSVRLLTPLILGTITKTECVITQNKQDSCSCGALEGGCTCKSPLLNPSVDPEAGTTQNSIPERHDADVGDEDSDVSGRIKTYNEDGKETAKENANSDTALPQGLAIEVGEQYEHSSDPTLPVLPCFEKQDQIAHRKSQTSDDASHGSSSSIVNISEQPYSVGHASPSEPVGPEVPCTLPPSRMRASLENSDQTINMQDISNQLTANPTRSTAVSNQHRAKGPREVTRSSRDNSPSSPRLVPVSSGVHIKRRRIRASLENCDQTMDLQDISNQLTANPTPSPVVSNRHGAESHREVNPSIDSEAGTTQNPIQERHDADGDEDLDVSGRIKTSDGVSVSGSHEQDSGQAGCDPHHIYRTDTETQKTTRHAGMPNIPRRASLRGRGSHSSQRSPYRKRHPSLSERLKDLPKYKLGSKASTGPKSSRRMSLTDDLQRSNIALGILPSASGPAAGRSVSTKQKESETSSSDVQDETSGFAQPLVDSGSPSDPAEDAFGDFNFDQPPVYVASNDVGLQLKIANTYSLSDDNTSDVQIPIVDEPLAFEEPLASLEISMLEQSNGSLTPTTAYGSSESFSDGADEGSKRDNAEPVSRSPPDSTSFSLTDSFENPQEEMSLVPGTSKTPSPTSAEVLTPTGIQTSKTPKATIPRIETASVEVPRAIAGTVGTAAAAAAAAAPMASRNVERTTTPTATETVIPLAATTQTPTAADSTSSDPSSVIHTRQTLEELLKDNSQPKVIESVQVVLALLSKKDSQTPAEKRTDCYEENAEKDVPQDDVREAAQEHVTDAPSVCSEDQSEVTSSTLSPSGSRGTKRRSSLAENHRALLSLFNLSDSDKDFEESPICSNTPKKKKQKSKRTPSKERRSESKHQHEKRESEQRLRDRSKSEGCSGRKIIFPKRRHTDDSSDGGNSGIIGMALSDTGGPRGSASENHSHSSWYRCKLNRQTETAPYRNQRTIHNTQQTIHKSDPRCRPSPVSQKTHAPQPTIGNASRSSRSNSTGVLPVGLVGKPGIVIRKRHSSSTEFGPNSREIDGVTRSPMEASSPHQSSNPAASPHSALSPDSRRTEGVEKYLHEKEICKIKESLQINKMCILRAKAKLDEDNLPAHIHKRFSFYLEQLKLDEEKFLEQLDEKSSDIKGLPHQPVPEILLLSNEHRCVVNSDGIPLRLAIRLHAGTYTKLLQCKKDVEWKQKQGDSFKLEKFKAIRTTELAVVCGWSRDKRHETVDKLRKDLSRYRNLEVKLDELKRNIQMSDRGQGLSSKDRSRLMDSCVQLDYVKKKLKVLQEHYRICSKLMENNPELSRVEKSFGDAARHSAGNVVESVPEDSSIGQKNKEPAESHLEVSSPHHNTGNVVKSGKQQEIIGTSNAQTANVNSILTPVNCILSTEESDVCEGPQAASRVHEDLSVVQRNEELAEMHEASSPHCKPGNVNESGKQQELAPEMQTRDVDSVQTPVNCKVLSTGEKDACEGTQVQEDITPVQKNVEPVESRPEVSTSHHNPGNKIKSGKQQEITETSEVQTPDVNSIQTPVNCLMLSTGEKDECEGPQVQDIAATVNEDSSVVRMNDEPTESHPGVSTSHHNPENKLKSEKQQEIKETSEVKTPDVNSIQTPVNCLLFSREKDESEASRVQCVMSTVNDDPSDVKNKELTESQSGDLTLHFDQPTDVQKSVPLTEDYDDRDSEVLTEEDNYNPNNTGLLPKESTEHTKSDMVCKAVTDSEVLWKEQQGDLTPEDQAEGEGLLIAQSTTDVSIKQIHSAGNVGELGKKQEIMETSDVQSFHVDSILTPVNSMVLSTEEKCACEGPQERSVKSEVQEDMSVMQENEMLSESLRAALSPYSEPQNIVESGKQEEIITTSDVQTLDVNSVVMPVNGMVLSTEEMDACEGPHMQSVMSTVEHSSVGQKNEEPAESRPEVSISHHDPGNKVKSGKQQEITETSEVKTPGVNSLQTPVSCMVLSTEKTDACEEMQGQAASELTVRENSFVVQKSEDPAETFSEVRNCERASDFLESVQYSPSNPTPATPEKQPNNAQYSPSKPTPATPEKKSSIHTLLANLPATATDEKKSSTLPANLPATATDEKKSSTLPANLPATATDEKKSSTLPANLPATATDEKKSSTLPANLPATATDEKKSSTLPANLPTTATDEKKSSTLPANFPATATDEKKSSTLPVKLPATATDEKKSSTLPANLPATANEEKKSSTLPANLPSTATDEKKSSTLPVNLPSTATDEKKSSTLPVNLPATATDEKKSSTLPVNLPSTATDEKKSSTLPVNLPSTATDEKKSSTLPVNLPSTATDEKKSSTLPANLPATANEEKKSSTLPANLPATATDEKKSSTLHVKLPATATDEKKSSTLPVNLPATATDEKKSSTLPVNLPATATDEKKSSTLPVNLPATATDEKKSSTLPVKLPATATKNISKPVATSDPLSPVTSEGKPQLVLKEASRLQPALSRSEVEIDDLTEEADFRLKDPCHIGASEGIHLRSAKPGVERNVKIPDCRLLTALKEVKKKVMSQMVRSRLVQSSGDVEPLVPRRRESLSPSSGSGTRTLRMRRRTLRRSKSPCSRSRSHSRSRSRRRYEDPSWRYSLSRSRSPSRSGRYRSSRERHSSGSNRRKRKHGSSLRSPSGRSRSRNVSPSDSSSDPCRDESAQFRGRLIESPDKRGIAPQRRQQYTPSSCSLVQSQAVTESHGLKLVDSGPPYRGPSGSCKRSEQEQDSEWPPVWQSNQWSKVNQDQDIEWPPVRQSNQWSHVCPGITLNHEISHY